MPTIDDLTPRPLPEPPAALRAADAAELARYVADPAQPWWRRRTCAQALAGRVPPTAGAALRARVTDPAEVAEVRVALLEVIGTQPELADWLARPERTREPYGVPAAVLRARAESGDLRAAPGLVDLAADPWPHRRTVGEAGLDALARQHGGPVVLAAAGPDRPAARRYAVRLRHRAGQDVTEQLADPDPAVAHLAASLATDPDPLRRLLARAPGTEAALRAVLALHRLTGEDAAAHHRALGSPRTGVPGLAEDVRRALVHHWAPRSTENTDPHWLVEALATEPPAPYDPRPHLDALATTLRAAGHGPRPPLSAGEDNGQGEGTYYVVHCDEGTDGVRASLFLSTLGPFAAGDPELRPAAEAAGVRWVTDEERGVLVPGLCVYWFGERGPQPVDTLLYYWQD